MSGRKETVLDLAKFVDKGVQVKLTGGRQVTGTLKGYDQLLNLVLDEAIEFLRDPDDPLKTTDQTRRLGLIVCRGTAVMLVSPRGLVAFKLVCCFHIPPKFLKTTSL
uniref:Putative U6 snRNA-associated Sm-like protein LSm7 n=1 Tax=Davidia involucrata TaxID=16924 RepID=A0A5B6ZKW5_DAVIN